MCHDDFMTLWHGITYVQKSERDKDSLSFFALHVISACEVTEWYFENKIKILLTERYSMVECSEEFEWSLSIVYCVGLLRSIQSFSDFIVQHRLM